GTGSSGGLGSTGIPASPALLARLLLACADCPRGPPVRLVDARQELVDIMQAPRPEIPARRRPTSAVC
ncbi:MAG: hypothetical protein Q4G67_15980, partial [Actinomycetia bacterium]|nr:hypothetical protein [Actinomycetes bacterium]